MDSREEMQAEIDRLQTKLVEVTAAYATLRHETDNTCHRATCQEIVDQLRAEIERLRARAYRATHHQAGSHSIACITWGDDGQGNLSDGGKPHPDACSCGAWPAWLKERAEQAEYQLAQVTQDYQTLRDAVNGSGECTDPEHGEGCACHADVMLSNLQARVREVDREITECEEFGIERFDPAMAELLRRIRAALSAAQPEGKP